MLASIGAVAMLFIIKAFEYGWPLLHGRPSARGHLEMSAAEGLPTLTVDHRTFIWERIGDLGALPIGHNYLL